MMRIKTYVEAAGQVCPRCGGDDLDFYDPENHPGQFQERVSCRCGFSFRRVFTLTGYDED